MIDLNTTLANIAKAIVDNPDEVKVIEKESDERHVVLELVVAPDDMGKVIGKHGRIA
ncbi:MAG: KH domain-containing protein, partial [Clostridia bacterium]|nr:KH domain-containing protein [Clostridia bacterium]